METVTWKEAKNARMVYINLLVAPLLAVPFSLMVVAINTDYQGISTGGLISASLIPLIFYIPVFLLAASKTPFVRAHARQGVLLIILRLLSWMGLVATETGWFLLLNFFLWLVGSLVGLSQVKKGKSWLHHLQVGIEPEPGKITNLPVGAQRQEFVAAALKVAAAGHTPMHRHEVVQILLEDFRAGNAEARQRAIKGLETLGEVESF